MQLQVSFSGFSLQAESHRDGCIWRV